MEKKTKMDGNTESVLKSGIKYRSASGSLRRPQTVPDWSGTKNRLSQFSGRFQPRSCRTQTDWVSGRLRPPGTKPRLSPGVLRPPQASSVFPRPGLPNIVLQSCWIFWVDIYKIRDLITIAFLGTQQDATF